MAVRTERSDDASPYGRNFPQSTYSDDDEFVVFTGRQYRSATMPVASTLESLDLHDQPGQNTMISPPTNALSNQSVSAGITQPAQPLRSLDGRVHILDELAKSLELPTQNSSEPDQPVDRDSHGSTVRAGSPRNTAATEAFKSDPRALIGGSNAEVTATRNKRLDRWTRSRSKGRQKRGREVNELLDEDDEAAIIQDYIRNMEENGEDLLDPRQLPRILGFEGGDEDTNFDRLAGSYATQAGQSQEGYTSVDSNSDGGESSGSERSEAVDDVNLKLEEDAELARLVAWEEKHGLDGLVEDFIPLGHHSQLGSWQTAKQRLRNTGRGGKKHRAKDHFPSASALADAIEQDPYGGFDIMEFDRPSLRPKKGKARELAWADAALAEELSNAWEQDRNKKALQKAEREELRAQGLLGNKNRAKLAKRGQVNDITLREIQECFRAFLESDEDSYVMPPAGDARRKCIHQIARQLGVKSISSGTGLSRRVNLMRTRRTVRFEEEIFEIFEEHYSRAMTRPAQSTGRGKGGKKRMSAGKAGRGSGRKSLPRGSGGGGGNVGAMLGYREGEIVGAAAPELSLDNRGRGMLERMGWSAGMALGAGENKGILQPVAQVVKNSRAGLG